MVIKDNVLVKVEDSDIVNGTFIIPENIEFISDYAFSHCEKLESINIPDGVTEIGNYAFSCCEKLEKIIIPESVIEIGYSAFSGCDSLTSIMIPEGITTIGPSVFSGCVSLTSITIPKSVIMIGSWAFAACKRLTNINIPDAVTKIGERAFEDCISLTSITIPISVTEIGICAFNGCTNLTSINITDSVIEIENYAFKDCTNLNLNNKTSLFRFLNNKSLFNNINTLTIYNYTFKDVNDAIYNLRKIRKEELMDKIKSELIDNGIKDDKCFKISEHKKIINKIINNLEIVGNYNYDYRSDFNNYINEYINKHKEEIINVEDTLKEIQNCEISYNELKKYPYIISTLRQNIETSYNKNKETIKLKKVLSKLTKIELNNPSDFIKLILKVFFDSDEGVVINKTSMENLMNYLKKQIEILEEQNQIFEILKEIIRVYFDKEKKCKKNLNESEDYFKNLESSEEGVYLNYEQITNGIDFNFSCIMKLKEITSVIILSLLDNYSLSKIILKRKEEIEILSNILNELNNIIETKERQGIEVNNLELLDKEKTYKK